MWYDAAMKNFLLHQTDLFHPHNDPDDHWDLACVFALAKAGHVDLTGVLIDYAPEHQKGDPAVHAVAQLAHCHAMPGIPVVIGSRSSMTHRRDGFETLPPCDQAAGEWLLQMLRDAPAPVAIMIVGSCIDVASAAVRDPGVFKEKCKGIYLNAGSAFPGDVEGEIEWNVYLNRAAYAAVFDIPCPVYWCPCWHRTNDSRVGKNGTWYNFRQGEILESLTPQMQNFFFYMLSRSNDPQHLRYLDRPVDPQLYAKHAAEMRNMWCTGPIFHTAGLTVDKEGNVGAFDEIREPLYTFESVVLECDDDGEVKWEPETGVSNRYIFTIHDTERYRDAMTTAMWRLLSAPMALA